MPKGNLAVYIERISGLVTSDFISYVVNCQAAGMVRAEDLQLHLNLIRDGLNVVKNRIEKIRAKAEERGYQDIIGILEEEI